MKSEDGSCNLIVNYIPPTMTDAELKAVFERIGPVSACKIIRDKLTGLSYGYGFIDFVNTEHACVAIESLDGLQLQNKRLKVSLSRQGNDVRASNLYISNLPKHVAEADLEELFNQFGEIIQTKVLNDPLTGVSRGVGFIRFSTREEAQRAMNAMNGQKPVGFASPILVKFAEDNREKAKKIQQAILGGSLNPATLMSSAATSPLGARQPFNVFGNGMPAGPMGNGAGNIPLGAGIGRGVGINQFGVGYQSDVGGGPMRGGGAQSRQRFDPMAFGAAAVANPAAFNNGLVGGMNGAGAAIEPNTGGYALFVYNIDLETDERALFQLFYPFGALLKVTVVRDKEKNISKGYGFVTMANMLEAQNAIHHLNGMIYKDKRLQVSLKQPKTPVNPVLALQQQQPATIPVLGGGGSTMAGNMPGGGIAGGHMMGLGAGGITSVPKEATDGKSFVLFVYNLSAETDERALWQLFSPFGAIQKVTVVRTSDSQQSKGFGFVTMVNQHEAVNAIQMLNGFPFNGRVLQVSFKQSSNNKMVDVRSAIPTINSGPRMMMF